MITKIAEKFFTYLSQAGIYAFGLAAIGLLLLIFHEEGIPGVWATLSIDVLRIIKQFIPIMLLFFIITGAINHLHARHPEKCTEIISGKYGVLPMLGLSMVMPGMAGGQQLRDAWTAPEVNRVNAILCLIAMMGGSMTMFIFRSRFIGPTLTMVWVGLVLGLLAQVWLIGRFKPWTWFT